MAAKASTNARKQDTREKIELGGLVVKAGLRLEKRAVLLGALVELAERLRNAPEERARLTAIGAKIFDNDRT
ncbi:MAG: conjugal transfer protein TraD [Alphaproteobacteria bacterium]|nr:conjugal transfer protein TraD [Alphaproteobacteria bacterium]